MEPSINELKVGDYVSFKYDIEQSGRILEVIRGQYGKMFRVRAFDGGYVDSINGTEIVVDARDCWID